jgi:trk system potassium uptake protein TrkH
VGAVAALAFLLLLVELAQPASPFRLLFRKINVTLLILFALDVCWRFWQAAEKREYCRHHWFDLIVFVPLIQFFFDTEGSTVGVAVRQVVILAMLISRTRKTRSFLALFSFRPAQSMTLSFAGAIGVGSVLLMLPAATSGGRGMSFVDALFTATSATCVTGLIVQDTATYLTTFGQLVVLGLIQVGGLGIMTFSVALAYLMGKQVSLKEQASLQDLMDQSTLAGIRRLLFFILGMTVAIEALGMLALTLAWSAAIPQVGPRLYAAFFHAISAFCNAGFSTFSDNLLGFQDHWATNLVIGALIVCGGLGFMVFKDLVDKRPFQGRGATNGRRLHSRIQTRMVLMTSGILIVAGTLLILVFEHQTPWNGGGDARSVLVALFQSISTRTAGFNTCDMGALAPATLFLMMLLMFIGASPGSTGGGIKTTTAAVLWLALSSSLRGQENVGFYRRTLPREIVQKAMSVTLMALVIVAGFTLLLLYTEAQPFSSILFEVVSAFGTVGLSVGITPSLTTPGKLLITVLMFIGRLGPLTIAYSFLKLGKKANYVYAEERVMID